MEIRADAEIAFSRPVVFSTYRDQMVELVPYLPNILKIEVREREDDPPKTRLVNIWHGGGEIPRAARAFLSESMLSWTDHARWDESDFTCAWRIETHAFVEAVRCEGSNRYVELASDRTRIEIRGDLSVDAKKVRGVPRMLAKTVGRTVEQFLVGHITPNLAAVSKGVERHLQEHGTGG